MPFIHTRPRYFAQILGELLYWIGEDRIQFSSDYAIWTPRWLVERFVDFQSPEDLTEYAPGWRAIRGRWSDRAARPVRRHRRLQRT